MTSIPRSACPLEEHDTEVGEIDLAIMTKVGAGIIGIPIDEKYREVDKVDLTITIEVGDSYAAGASVLHQERAVER